MREGGWFGSDGERRVLTGEGEREWFGSDRERRTLTGEGESGLGQTGKGVY